MSSKKEKTDKKLKKLMTAEAATPKKGGGKKEAFLPVIKRYAEAPLYTALIMVAAIVVLFFIFTVIQNTVVADIVLNKDPSLSGNNEAFLAATEQFALEHPLYSIIRNSLLSIAGILAMMMLFYRLEKCEMTSVGLMKTDRTKVDVGMGLVFGLVAALLVFNLLALFGYIKPTGAFVFNYYQIAWTLYIVFAVAFEELFFRGYIIFKLVGKSPILAIIVSGAAFALYKGLPSTLPSTYITYFILGAMLAYSVYKFGTVWFATAFRGMWTILSAMVFSMDSAAIIGIFENGGLKESILSGSRAGCENGLIAGFVFALCFVLIIYLNKKRSEKHVRKIHKDGTIH